MKDLSVDCWEGLRDGVEGSFQGMNKFCVCSTERMTIIRNEEEINGR